MEFRRIKSVNGGLHGEVEIPGDKSISHRAVMFAGLSDTPVKITNFLRSADCLSTVHCMKALGAQVEDNGKTLTVCGSGLHGLREPEKVIDAGNSGTTLRLMLGILAGQKFLTTFCGDASLSKRPMQRVIAPLGEMGANIVGRKFNTRLPITVLPATKALQAITYEMPMASAQVKSAILLAGLYAKGTTTVIEPYPSRDHTERMLNAFGAVVNTHAKTITIEPPEKLTAPEEIAVPGDISSAAYFLVAASIIKGSDIILKNVGMNKTRTGIIDVLQAMGADITVQDEHTVSSEPVADLRVRAAKLHGVQITKEIIPRLIDEIPIITVAAMAASGTTTISGAEELRVKETDRLQAINKEFSKFSDGITEKKDGLIIKGGLALKEAQCNTYSDHRIAMSLAIAGAYGVGVCLQDADCVNISYPTFYDNLQMLGNNHKVNIL